MSKKEEVQNEFYIFTIDVTKQISVLNLFWLALQRFLPILVFIAVLLSRQLERDSCVMLGCSKILNASELGKEQGIGNKL